MSKKSERNQVIRDERDAEKAFKAHIAQAEILARTLADDQARKDTERAAAREAQLALSRIEASRKEAEKLPDAAAAKQSFWKRLLG